MVARVDNPPIPTAAPRPVPAEQHDASSPDMIADLITTSSIAKASDIAPVGWQIQISAANSREAATAMLERVRMRFDDALGSVTPYTEPVTQGSTTLYRARFTGFESREAANDACETLEQQHLSCLALSAHG
jgi:cell division septation protein DedD